MSDDTIRTKRIESTDERFQKIRIVGKFSISFLQNCRRQDTVDGKLE